MLVSRPWFGILAEGDIITAGPRGSQWVATRSCRVGMVHCEVIARHCEPLRATQVT